jgi:hypothetical protein
MSRANFFWDSKNRSWTFRGSNGNPAAYIYDGGFVFPEKTGTIANVNVGTLATLNTTKIGGGTTITKVAKHTGTIALAAIGTSAIAVATVSGLGSANIAVGDLIFYTLKGAATAASVFAGKAYIPTTNVVCIDVGNTLDTGGGSLPAVGVDIVQIKF